MFILSKILYNLSLKFYYYSLLLASLFNKKASLWINGRKKSIQKVNGQSIWFHCASLGEFEQARPLIEKLKKDYSNYKIVITFYSPSGYEIRKDYKLADYIYYLPLDTAKNAKMFIEKINPSLVFFVKYEFWHHYINELKNNNIPIFLISGIFRNKQTFFKWYGTFFRKILNNFTHLFVQDENSLSLLKSINLNNASIAKDSRFDRVYDIYKEAKNLPKINKFVGSNKCIVIGSSWLEDEKIFYSIKENISAYKLIIAPHNITTTRIAELKVIFSNSILYSEIDTQNIDKQVLIVDNIGMLSSIYRYGTIAYIGGGFGVSIHNILEAAVYSVPVIFGPAHKKMKEATDLIDIKGGFTINGKNELETLLIKLKDSEYLKTTSNISGKYVFDNTGGTKKVISFLKSEMFLQKVQ